MAEYTYTRELVSGKYNINSGSEKTKLQEEIVVALPGKNLTYVNCHGTDVKVGIDSLDAGEKAALDTVVQDHKDASATNLIHCYRLTGDCSDPTEKNVALYGLFLKRAYDNLGALTTEEYYTTYDGTTYSDLVFKKSFVYTAHEVTTMVLYNDATWEWYLTDDSVGVSKPYRTYYNFSEAIKHHNERRDNLIGEAQTYGVLNIVGMHVDGILNGHHFFLSIQSDLEKYRFGVNKEAVIDNIQASTETYLTQQMKDDFEGILDYWT